MYLSGTVKALDSPLWVLFVMEGELDTIVNVPRMVDMYCENGDAQPFGWAGGGRVLSPTSFDGFTTG